MKELTWLGAGLAALLLGCASAPPVPQGEKTVPGAQYLAGSEWELRDLGGTPVLEDQKPTMAFLEPGRVSGSGSCNRYTGSAELGDGTIKVSQLASTKMACIPDVDNQERAFLNALQNARKMELVDGELVVHTDSLEQPLRFRRIR